MNLKQLLGHQGRAKVGVALLDERHDQITDRLRQAGVARSATPLGDQTGRTTSAKVLQQPEDLSAFEPEQGASVPNGYSPCFYIHQNIKPGKLLGAHRHHRHTARPPAAPKSRRVPFELCRGVSSLYCAYMLISHKPLYGMDC